MENQKKKKSYSSLPSNYVTLAQLQQRWLDQQNHKGEKLQQDEGAIVVPANGTAPTSHRAGDSRAGRREAEAGAGIGDEIADLDGKVAESSSKKKMMMQWSRKPERKGANEGGSKGAIRSEVNGKKSVDLVKVEEEDEQKFKASSSVNAVKEKQNGRMKKVELKGASEEGSKAAIRSEANGNSVNVAEAVEQKFRASSTNTATEKQNGKIRRMKKVDQKGAIEGGSKTKIGSEINEKKSVDSEKVEEQSEQKFGASSVKGKKQNGRMKSSEESSITAIATEMNEKGKQNWRIRGLEQKGAGEEGPKTAIGSKLNGKKRVEEEAEEEFGDFSVNSVKGKQNGRMRRMNDGGYGGGGRDCGNGHRRGGGLKFNDQQPSKMVWVKKDDGGIILA